MLGERWSNYDSETCCVLYSDPNDLGLDYEKGAPTRDGWGNVRHSDCIAAHGGAE